MRAITIIPGTSRVELQDFPEPELLTSTQVKIQILEVGICGTDREEAMGGRADAPPESPYLIIGHEMFGKVVDVGEDVATVSIGDLAVLSVRRGCGRCFPCLNNRSVVLYRGIQGERN